MIHKIERLHSVGKFRNYTAAGDVSFQKLTMIYADNGSGKTTLTSVIRSLANQIPDLVRTRISTNHAIPQAAQIIKRDANAVTTSHNLTATGWSNPYPNIEIFDSHFVNDNVYSGFEFRKDHKEQLYRFVIGQQAVQLQQWINANKAAKAASIVTQNGYITQLIQLVGNGLNEAIITPFLNIQPNQNPNLPAEITAAQITLTSAQQRGVIDNFQSLNQMSPLSAGINFDFENMINDLRTSPADLQNAALRTLYETHQLDLNQNNLAESESWLQRGYRYVLTKQNGTENEENCPFCRQEIANTSDILRAYSQHFNEEFNAYVARISGYLQTIQGVNFEMYLSFIETVHAANTGRHANWTTYINALNLPDGTIIPNGVDLLQQFRDLVEVLSSKLQNPSVPLPAFAAEAFRDTILQSNQNLQDYNAAVAIYNNAIIAFKAAIPNLVTAQDDFNRLTRIEKRADAAVDSICTSLIQEKAAKDVLDTAYTQMVANAATTANLFLTSYETRINHYLDTVFNTPFRIANTTHRSPQGQGSLSRTEYTLTIDGVNISTEPNQPFAAKDVLSEGDKSTIALAFFLSKLDVENDKANKVLIFDDPLSSFDAKRRRKTINLLATLSRDSKQLVVLSHDKKFLFDLHRLARSVTKKGLKITFDSTIPSSKFEFLDIERMLQNEYFICLNKIKEFIQNGVDEQKEELRREIRIALENYIIFQFYGHFNGDVPATFPRIIERLTNLVAAGTLSFRDVNSRQVLDDLRELDAISWDSHHGDGDIFDNRDEIQVADIDLAEFKGYLSTTLNLIEQRL